MCPSEFKTMLGSSCYKLATDQISIRAMADKWVYIYILLITDAVVPNKCKIYN